MAGASMAWRNLRDEVCDRNGWRCSYCGIGLTTDMPAIKTTATADHLIPRSMGGTDDPSNLLASCFSCNASRRERPLEWFRRFRALQLTPLSAIITLRQYDDLVEAGVQMPPLAPFAFFFETPTE